MAILPFLRGLGREWSVATSCGSNPEAGSLFDGKPGLRFRVCQGSGVAGRQRCFGKNECGGDPTVSSTPTPQLAELRATAVTIEEKWKRKRDLHGIRVLLQGIAVHTAARAA
jgi:hypothetical protein